MEIESIRHRALRRFAETGKPRGVIEPDRIRNILAYIAEAGSFDELSLPPNFKLHELKGERMGTFAMTVTRNWRLTFVRYGENGIADLDLEDYH